MRFKELETVVLNRDLPDKGLQRGDLGAVVQVYEPDGLEVEFVSASGKTEALVTLKETDVRAVADGDLIAVRRLGDKRNAGEAIAITRPESQTHHGLQRIQRSTTLRNGRREQLWQTLSSPSRREKTAHGETPGRSG